MVTFAPDGTAYYAAQIGTTNFFMEDFVLVSTDGESTFGAPVPGVRIASDTPAVRASMKTRVRQARTVSPGPGQRTSGQGLLPLTDGSFRAAGSR